MTLDELDKKVLEVYPDYVINKSLVRKLKIGYNVPVYVLEHLLGSYADFSDPENPRNIENVENILKEHFFRPDEAEYMKMKLRDRGRFRIIDRVSATLDTNSNQYDVFLQNLNVNSSPRSEVKSSA